MIGLLLLLLVAWVFLYASGIMMGIGIVSIILLGSLSILSMRLLFTAIRKKETRSKYDRNHSIQYDMGGMIIVGAFAAIPFLLLGFLFLEVFPILSIFLSLTPFIFMIIGFYKAY